LLDGRNRLDAMEMVGVPIRLEEGKLEWRSPATDHWCCFQSVVVRAHWPNGDPYAYVISANIHRRHLTAEQKRDIIAKVLKAQPEKSNRTIAKQTKVDDKTVAAVRTQLEATAEIPQLTKTVGADGRTRRVPQPRARQARPEQPKPKTVKPADTASGTIHQQVTALYKELKNFSNDYCARLTQWIETHDLDEDCKVGLMEVLEDTAMSLQRLAQQIDGR
jgi:hypothetical protein